MKQLIIIGAGGMGRTLYDMAQESIGYGNEFLIKGFIDDNMNALDGFNGYPSIIGSISSYVPEDEDISYEMSVNAKRYDAYFVQVPEITDSAAVANKLKEKLLTKYTQEQLASPTEEVQADIVKASSELAIELMANKPVWFTISDFRGEYYITMFYDNEYNRAQGEDL